MAHASLGGDLIKIIVGQNIARLIASTPGMSQSELARTLKRNHSGINHYINGLNMPNANALARIADVFGIEVHELFIRPKKKRLICSN